MEGLFTAHMGAPVFSFDKKEVWAYWNETRTFTSRVFKFHTRSQLLEGDTFRETEVIYTGQQWVAGVHCIQQDFAETPFFFMNPLAGPQARLAALRLLLADPNFQSYFRENIHVGTFQAYEHYLEREAKDHVPF